ncbi:MAG: amidohydrolase, partial [Bacillota bacterium]
MLAIIDARLHRVSAPAATGGLLVRDGKIEEVGDVQVPEGAEVIDARGRDVTPGIIEAHCHAGLVEEGIGWEGSDGNERSDPITPAVRAIDGANPEDKAFQFFREAGITTSQLTPGSANIIGGEGMVAKSRETVFIDDMIILRPSGMKAALGENPKRVYGPKKSPATRMGNAAVMRKWLARARSYAQKRDRGDDVDFDFSLESLLPVMRREIPLRIHCHRADDIASALRLADEFDLVFSLEHVTAGRLLADRLAELEVPCAVGPSMMHESKVEVLGNGFENAVEMHRAGVKMCLTNDHPVIHGRMLPTAAGLLQAAGVSAEAAL